MTGFIISIIIGGIAGWLAGLIRKGSGFGVLGNVVVGILGGLVGGLLAGAVGIDSTNWLGQLAISTFGAVVLLAIINLVKK
jgi:uncharacterized membrane protein YeaQ/YmgE (transglycosylase-associated protein family)